MERRCCSSVLLTYNQHSDLVDYECRFLLTLSLPQVPDKNRPSGFTGIIEAFLPESFKGKRKISVNLAKDAGS